MMFLEEYKNALNYIKKYIQDDLSILEIESAQIYGSVTYGKGFNSKISDIDICVFTNKMSFMPIDQIVEIITNTNIDFKDKYPTIIRDHITGTNRIEFYINHSDISFDITVLNYEFPVAGDFIKTASYDSLEMIIGSLYQHGYPLFGKIPCLDEIKDKFIPYYSDELRLKRLQIIGKRLINYNRRLEEMVLNKDNDIVDHLYKSRTYFLKWLFIFLRKYPVHIQKHLDYQLSDILKLKDNEKSSLLFIGEGNIFDIASAYLKTVKHYFEMFSKENKKLK